MYVSMTPPTFSLGHKLSYDYDSNSDSVASENQPLENFLTHYNFFSTKLKKKENM